MKEMVNKLEKLSNGQIVGLMLSVSAGLVVVALGIRLLRGQKVVPVSLGPKPKVAATIFPVYDMVKKVAGEAVEVELILPPGGSPHAYEPRPSQVAELAGVELVFMVGHGLDEWAGEMAANAGDAELVVVDKDIQLLESSHDHGGEEEHGHEDPHYWLNVPNGLLMSKMIKEVLSEKFPERAEVFEVNQNEYAKALAKTDLEIRGQLAGLDNKSLVTFHGGWEYLTKEYGLSVAAVFEEVVGSEPTANHLADFEGSVKNARVKVIFSEPQLAGGQVTGVANDLGLVVWELDPLGGVEGRESYIEMMKFNASQIVQSQ